MTNDAERQDDRLSGLSVFLIGMMGVGKTSVGQALARQLCYRFFDTDTVIERASGVSIREIFAREGEAAFRELETQVLGELAGCTRSAIATGGGIVIRRQNWSYLHHGLIVWLDAPVELVLPRLAGDATRPLLSTDDPAARWNRLLDERRSLYAEADLRIVLQSEQSPEAIASEIVERIPSLLKPPPA